MDYSSQVSQKIIITEKGKLRQIALECISHVRCDGYISIIYTSSKEINTAIPVCISLLEIESKFKGYHFLRVDRNCIVNLKYVEILDAKTKTITMQNQTKLKVSRRRYSEVSKYFAIHT